jgi:manganese transport protein
MASAARVLRYQRVDVIVALSLAGLINLTMLAVAAKLLHVPGLTGTDTIQGAHAQFGHLVGGGAALAFAVALLLKLAAFVVAGAITAMNVFLIAEKFLA